MAKDERGLTKKQKDFCEQYVLTGNATRSYMKAFNKTEEQANLCGVEGHKLLKNQDIINYIAELTKQKNPLLTEEWLCDRLLEIINNPNTRECDRLKAIDMLFKCLGSYTINQKVDANITGEQTIKVTIEDDE